MSDPTPAGGVVLIADDNPEARRMLETRVRREGHRILMAENGREALEVLAREPVDVILLDIEMPEVNGYGVLAAVRADPRLSHIPVLIISGGGDQDDMVRCIEMGAVDYLPKPFNQAVLRARIGACLAQKRQRDRERQLLQASLPGHEPTPVAGPVSETKTWVLNRPAGALHPEPPPPAAHQSPAPTRLGRIALGRLLGSGGMGRVYLGHHELLDLPVAVKLMRAELTAVPHARERLLREARMAVRLAHRHIVRLLEVGETEDGVYLAFDYIDGGTLSDLLDRQPGRRLPVPEAVRVVSEVAAALAEANKLGIIHRDIKPSNLLLTPAGEVRVGDFGLAKQEVAVAAADSQLTMEGMVVGTPLYMAPEQLALGGRVDGRADLYALGSVLYELLVGHAPFGGPLPAAETPVGLHGSHAVFHHLNHTTPRPPGAFRPDVPAWLEAVCLRLLAKSPGDRFQTPDELLAAVAAGVSNPAAPPV